MVGGYPLWDAHTHLFPERLFQAIWRWFDRRGWRIPFKEPTARLIQSLTEIGVEKAFFLTYAHKPGMSLELNRWMKSVVEKYPMLVPFGSIHPEDENLEEVISKTLDEWNFCGFKIHLLVQDLAADDPGLFPIYEALEERGKVLVIHAGGFPFEDDPEAPRRLARVFRKFPRLKAQVAHMGMFRMEQTLELVEEYPGIYLDTAYVFGNPELPLRVNRMEEILHTYRERIIFGSDFPIMEFHPLSSVKALLDLKLPDEIYRQIFRENARQLVEG
ncbi:amidohydrolase family protein [Calderihabitans maritimus]|uniref:Amidohydrolase family protein n=1 Tax=Calderihabitans maritimus TaxID=1246530 RepID=A0A1Z5HXZ0_9FIRM|nr:amidohydrolase family protein [Calderihabitans maritimus]GAW94392.1 amidohydrolase family protein [Calderihabitans maritimus]